MNTIDDIVREHPGEPAIVHNGETISYSRLSAQAAAADPAMLQQGFAAVSTAHHPDTVVAMLAGWRAGGAYVPLDPAFPAHRRSAMLRAIQDSPLPPDAAYLLFTSGSTGEPKPVVTPWPAIDAVIPALRELFELTPADRVLQFASLNWDTCFEEVLPVLTTGATLVFDDEAHTGSLPRLLRAIARSRITVLDLPTAFWHELVRHLAEERATLPECVRLMIIGGEAVNPVRLAQWCELDIGCVRLLNTYGCTETTLITHAADLPGPPAALAPIGRALPHVTEHLSAEGELLVGGPALALGYHGMPEATSARFPTIDGRRYFRTGDRVSRLPSGMLQHLGRIDNEVKVRGVRVDPAEVEAQLAGHPAVRAVAVVPITVAEHTSLRAYIVVAGHPGDLVDDLATDVLVHLRSRLPAHLVPSRVVVVPELAYTATGKVDRLGSHRRYEQEVSS